MSRQGDISLQSSVRINDQVLCQELQGEAVLMNLETGIYLGLDPVGTRIWNLLHEYSLLSDVLHAMLKEYDVAEQQCAQDLLRLVADMEEHGLAEVTR